MLSIEFFTKKIWLKFRQMFVWKGFWGRQIKINFPNLKIHQPPITFQTKFAGNFPNWIRKIDFLPLVMCAGMGDGHWRAAAAAAALTLLLLFLVLDVADNGRSKDEHLCLDKKRRESVSVIGTIWVPCLIMTPPCKYRE